MAIALTIHPETPQPRLLEQAVSVLLASGSVAAIPSDSCYALACRLGDKSALEKLRAIRAMDERHHLTLMCRDLSDLGQYARVDNSVYRLLKAATPGPYTFILEGTRDLPRRILHPKRKTLGLRVPNHVVTQGLLSSMGEPLLTTTLLLPGDEDPMTYAWEIRDRLESQLDLIVDGGHCGIEPTTVVDLSTGEPQLIRKGCGSLAVLGL